MGSEPLPGTWTEGRAAGPVGPNASQALVGGGGQGVDLSPVVPWHHGQQALGLSDQWETCRTLTSSGGERTYWQLGTVVGRKPVQTRFLGILFDCFSMCVCV